MRGVGALGTGDGAGDGDGIGGVVVFIFFGVVVGVQGGGGVGIVVGGGGGGGGIGGSVVVARLGVPPRVGHDGFAFFGQHGGVDPAEHHGGWDGDGGHEDGVEEVDRGEFGEEQPLAVAVEGVPG